MKRLIILAATLIAGLSACDSLLDKEPLDRVTQFDYFKTRSDLELFSNPFYDNLLDKTPYDEQNDLLVQMTLSDVLYGGDKRTVPNPGGGWSWGNLRRINTLLEYVDQCEDKKAVTEYTALAKFFRAAFYFDKVKRFGDVPWYEVQLGSADEALYKPRDSRELIMTNMIKDIDEAINSGGLTEDISTYRVNKWAALALKARFCLFEGTYRKYHGINLEGHDYTYYLEEAAKAAKTIIDEGPYKLYSTKTPDKDYMMLFAQENASTEEYILAIRNSYEAQVYHNATAYTLLPTQAGERLSPGGHAGLHPQIHQHVPEEGRHGIHRPGGVADAAFHRGGEGPRPAPGAVDPHPGLQAHRRQAGAGTRSRRHDHRLPTHQIRSGHDGLGRTDRPQRPFDLRHAGFPLCRSAAQLCRSQGRTGNAHAERSGDHRQRNPKPGGNAGPRHERSQQKYRLVS